MSRGRRLVEALAAVASRYSPESRKEKRALLEALERSAVGHPPTLSRRATTAEGDAFSEGGMGWREWLGGAKGGRQLAALQLLLEVFGRTGLPAEARDWLCESVGLPTQWRPRGPGASRTLARIRPARVFFHEAGLDRSAADLVDALSRPLPAL